MLLYFRFHAISLQVKLENTLSSTCFVFYGLAGTIEYYLDRVVSQKSHDFTLLRMLRIFSNNLDEKAYFCLLIKMSNYSNLRALHYKGSDYHTSTITYKKQIVKIYNLP